MFVARDVKGNLVNALEKDVTKQPYTCPACGGGLRLRQGQSIRTHFAHERLRDYIAIFENESSEHGQQRGPLSLGQERQSGRLRIQFARDPADSRCSRQWETSSGGPVQSLVSKAFMR